MTDPARLRQPMFKVLLCAILCWGGLFSANAVAQDESTVTTYTRVALWQVPRARWEEFTDYYTEHDKPVMEQLFKDGAITEWGIDAMSIHKSDGYTHSTWFSAESWEQLESVWDAYDAYWKKMGKDKAKKLDLQFASMVTKHRDYVLKTDGQRANAASLNKAGYFKGAFIKVKFDHFDDFKSYYDNRVMPIYEQLLKDGAITAYGVSDEEIQTEAPGGVTMWYVSPNAAGMDRVREAFQADWAKQDKEGRRARFVSIMDFVEEGSYREFLSHLVHYQTKAM